MLSQIDIFQDIYDQLTNIQRAVLQALSKIDDVGICSDKARTRYKLPVSSSLTEALKSLQKRALIYKDSNEYKFSNPIFQEWLLTLE